MLSIQSQNKRTTIKEVIEACSTTVYESTDETPGFSLKGVRCAARIFKVYDGDTVRMAIEIPWAEEPRQVVMFRVRLDEIDTAEIRTKNESEKRMAIAARDRLREMVDQKVCCVECGPLDVFGRVIAKIYTVDGVNVAHQLVSEGLAVPYSERHLVNWEKMLEKYLEEQILGFSN
jgi:endonuclease YncB( thermonuclease family)